MQFEHTLFLAAGLLACVGLGWFYRRTRNARRNLLQQFASPHLVERLTANVSQRKRNLKLACLVLAVACVFVALSRPQAGFRWEETHRKGIDILMAVDTSKSMLANDVQPNRLERAKLGILDFVSKLEGDRVGLIPFSGTSFLMCPLTLDYDAFRRSLNSLDTALMPRGGTDIAGAIREAEAAFAANANHRILVLITDGEDLEGEAAAAAKAAAKRGITIHAVGVGTPEGELIPVATGGAGFVTDEQGQVVKSRLDEDMLTQIATATGGAYEPLGRQAEGLEAIYQQNLSLVPREEFAQRMRRVPVERFQWPLLFALILLVFEYGLSDRKFSRRPERTRVTTAGRRTAWRRKVAAAVPAGLLLVSMIPPHADASSGDGTKAYERGEFATAAEEYQKALEKSPGNPALLFNAGAADYKNGHFAGAAGAFEAVVGDDDLTLQERAYYNLGNALYREGQGTEQSNPEQTIQQWEQSLTSYEGTLALNSEHEDAQYNHEFVKRRLEELKKQQEQEPEDQQQDQEPPECETPEQQEDSNNREAGSDENEEEQEDEKSDSRDNSADENSDPEQEPESDERQPGNEPEPEGGSNDSEQDKPAPGEEEEAPAQPEPNPGQEQPAEAGQDDAPSGIGDRREPGQMTPGEAEDLLDSLQGDEGDTPFVPMPQGGDGRRDDDPRRDW